MLELDTAARAELIDIVQRAGAAILEVYETDFEVVDKSDTSPLTQADLAAHRIIVAGLQALTPEVPIMSEEGEVPPFSERQHWDAYWLVDPLDGTKEFVNRNGEFTVNIALIEAGLPVWGIVGVPVQEKIFIGDVRAERAELITAEGTQPIGVRKLEAQPEHLEIVASRSHGGERLEGYLDALAQTVPTLGRKPVGSSLKLCTLATGDADLYPRLGPTSEWDIGAAHAVLRAAGGEVYSYLGGVLGYNQEENILNPEFYAVGDRSFDWDGFLPEYPAP